MICPSCPVCEYGTVVPRDTDRHGNTKRETPPPIRMEREYIAGEEGRVCVIVVILDVRET